MTMPPMETLTELKLTDPLKQLINEAYVPNDFPLMIAHIEDGAPRITFRGSTHVHSDDQIAIWARHADGGLAGGLAANPNVFITYREPNPEGGMSRAIINMRGRGRIASDEATRDRVYNTMPEVERQADQEKQGVAIIIDLDSVTGFVPGYRLNMQRE